MAYPIDVINKCKETRKIWTGALISFSAGAFFNLLPFLDFSDVNRITATERVFLGIDVAALSASVVVYLAFTWKLRRIRGDVLASGDRGQ